MRDVLAFQRGHELLQNPPAPEGLAIAVIIVALDQGFALRLADVVQHQGLDAMFGRAQAVGDGIVADVQPALRRNPKFLGDHREGLARGLGEKGVGRGGDALDIGLQAGMGEQAPQVGGGEVHVRDHQQPLALAGQFRQPGEEGLARHQHGVFHGQLEVGDPIEQVALIAVGEDVPQQILHEARVAGLMVDEARTGLLALAPLDVVTQSLHFPFADAAAAGPCQAGDIARHRQLDQVGVVDAPHQQGVEEVEGDDVLVGGAGPASGDELIQRVEGPDVHGTLYGQRPLPVVLAAQILRLFKSCLSAGRTPCGVAAARDVRTSCSSRPNSTRRSAPALA